MNPFHRIAMEMGIEEEELIKRLKYIKDSGLIRRVGAVFDSSKMGYKSTLVGLKVPKKDIFEVVKAINHYDEITHNYYRVNGQKNSLKIMKKKEIFCVKFPVNLELRKFMNFPNCNNSN
jgi:DNA-binding Lrp family transcriptional regulator